MVFLRCIVPVFLISVYCQGHVTAKQGLKLAVFSWNSNHENVAESWKTFRAFHDIPTKYFDSEKNDADLLVMCIQEDQSDVTVASDIDDTWTLGKDQRKFTLAGGSAGRSSAYIYFPTKIKESDQLYSITTQFEGDIFTLKQGKGYVDVAININDKSNQLGQINVACAHLHAHAEYKERGEAIQKFFTHSSSAFSVMVGDYNYRLQVDTGMSCICIRH